MGDSLMAWNVPLHLRNKPSYRIEPHGFRWVHRFIDALAIAYVLLFFGALTAVVIQILPIIG